MDSVSHKDEYNKDLAKEVHRFSMLVGFEDSPNGGLMVHPNS